MYSGELTTRTAYLTTSNVLWNRVVSTKGATFAGADINDFYLGTPLGRYEYMQMNLKVFPPHIGKPCNLDAKTKGGFLYLEIRTPI